MTDQTDSVTVKFRLTVSDVFLAVARQTMRTLWFLMLLPVAGTVSIVWAIVDPANGAVTLKSGCVALAFGVVLFGALPYLQARAAMKSPNFGGLIALTISARGIQVTGDHSNATIGWAMVKGVSEMKHAILLNLKPAGFQIIPKDQLSYADVTAFKDVLRRHAPGKVRLAKA